MGSVPTPNQPNFELETHDSGINSACLKFEVPIYRDGLDGAMYVINENNGTPIVEAAFNVNLNHRYLALINYPPYADLPTEITPFSSTVGPVLFGSTYCISYRLKLQNTYHIVLRIGSNVYKSNSAYLNSFGISLQAGGITAEQNPSTFGMELDFTIPPSNVLSNSWQVHITGVPAANQQQNSGPLTQAIFNLTTSLIRSTDPFNIRITNKLPISDPYTAIDVTSYSGTVINFCLLDGYVYTIAVNGGTLLSSNAVLMESPKINVSQITPIDVALDFDIYCIGTNNAQLAGPGLLTSFPAARNTGNSIFYYSKLQVNLFAGDNYTLVKTFPVSFKLIEGVQYNVSDRSAVQAGLNKWRIQSRTFDVDPYANLSEPIEATDQANGINMLYYPLVDGIKYKITITDPTQTSYNDLFNGQPEYTYTTPPRINRFNIPNLGSINYATSTVLLRLYQNNTNSTALAILKIQPGGQVEPWQIVGVSPASTGTITSNFPDFSIINYPLFGGNTYIITISVYPGQVRSSLDFRLPTIEYVSNSFQYAGIPALITSPTTNPLAVNVKDGEPGNSILSVSGFSYGTVYTIDWARNEAPAVSLSTTVSLPPRFSSTTRRNNSDNTFIIGDEGTYVCTITDSFGYSKVSFTVTVTPAAPVFSGDISSQGGKLSGTGTIYTFRAPPISTGRSLPITYVWTFKANGASTATVISTKVGDGTCPITLNRSTSLGVYTVTATNSVGSSTPVSTSITFIGDRPVMNILKSQTVCSGTTVCLENKQPDTVYPPPTFEWYFNGNKIYGATGSFYNIYEAVYPNSGKYDCIAINEVDSVPSITALITVFKTSNSGIGHIETYSSGQGYSAPPYLGLYGGGSQAIVAKPTVDKLYIRRVRITGGNTIFTSTPTVTAAGANLIAVTEKQPTERYLSDAPLPPGLLNKTVYQPIILTVNGSGSGAQILPVLDTTVGSTLFRTSDDPVIVGYNPAQTTILPLSTFTPGSTGYWNGKQIAGTALNPPNFNTVTLTFVPQPIYGPTGYNITGGGVVAAFQWNTGPNLIFANFIYNKNEIVTVSGSIQAGNGGKVLVSPQYIGDNETVQGPVLNTTKVKPCVVCWSTAFLAGAFPGADVAFPPVVRANVISTNPSTPYTEMMRMSNQIAGGLKVEVTWKDITWDIDGYRENSRNKNGRINNVRIYEPQVKILDPGNGYLTQPLIQLMRTNFDLKKWVPWDDKGVISPDGNPEHFCSKGWYYCDLAHNYNVTLSPTICQIQTSINSPRSTVSDFSALFSIKNSNLNFQTVTHGYSEDIRRGMDAAPQGWNQETTSINTVVNTHSNNGLTVGTALVAAALSGLYGFNAETLLAGSPSAIAELALITPTVSGSTNAAQISSEAIQIINAAQNSASSAGFSINNPLQILGASQDASQYMIAASLEEYVKAQKAMAAAGISLDVAANTYTGTTTIISSRITELQAYQDYLLKDSTRKFRNYTKAIGDLEAALTDFSKVLNSNDYNFLIKQYVESGKSVTSTAANNVLGGLTQQAVEELASAQAVVNTAKSALIEAGTQAQAAAKVVLQEVISSGSNLGRFAQEALDVLTTNPSVFANNIASIVDTVKTLGGGANTLMDSRVAAVRDVDGVVWRTLNPDKILGETTFASYDWTQKMTKAVAELSREETAKALNAYNIAIDNKSAASKALQLSAQQFKNVQEAARRGAFSSLSGTSKTSSTLLGDAASTLPNVAENAMIKSVQTTGRAVLVSLSTIFNIATLIADVISIVLEVLQSITGGATLAPDTALMYWMSDGILPFAAGSLIISPGVRIKSLYIENPGSGYSAGNTTITIKTGGSTIESPYFQGTSTPTSKTFTGSVSSSLSQQFLILTAIGIVDQGNGFTGAPSIQISGGGGDGTTRAVADMSCSALGPIRHTTTDYFSAKPIVKIAHGTDLMNPATAVAYPSSTIGSGIIRGIKILPSLISPRYTFIGGYLNFRLASREYQDTFWGLPLERRQHEFHPLFWPPMIQKWFKVRYNTDDRPLPSSQGAPQFRINGTIQEVFTNISDSYLVINSIDVINGGYGFLTRKPILSLMLTDLGATVFNYNYNFLDPVMDYAISRIVITDNGLGYDEIPKIEILDRYTGAVRGTTVGSTGYASNFTSAVNARGLEFPAGSSNIIVPNYFIQNFTVVSGGTGYTGPPDIGITGTGVVTNVIDSATVVSTTNTAQGVSIAVGSGGYYEFEPLSEFGSARNQAGLNIQIIPASNDTIADSQAYAIPVMNGRIIDCTNGIGIACYGTPLTQLPYTPAGINVTITPVDGSGSGAAITVSKYHYSFDLNAYILDNFTITNPGSNYRSSPVITVTFVDSSSNALARANFYPRIGGPIASVNVINSSVGFQFTPTTKLLPYGQTGNNGGSYTPSSLTVNWTPLTIGSVSTVYLGGQQPKGYTGPPEVILYDTPRLGGNKAIVTANMGLFYLTLTKIDGGLGYSRPPTVVFTTKSGLGGGAVAKAVLGEKGAVVKIIFATYGGGWINEMIYITFAPHPLDNPSNIKPGNSACYPVFSTVTGPPKVFAHPIDGDGSGAAFNVSVNNGLYLTGSTGFSPFMNGILDVPNTIAGIAPGAFGNQRYITDLVFNEPSECFEIGNYAFAGCTGLRSAYIPKSVERIGRGAFHNCQNLKIVQFEGRTGPAFGTNAFLGCTGVYFYLTTGATSVLSSYGGGTGWVGLSTSNHLGVQIGITGITGPNYDILAVKPQGILGFTPLKQAIIPIPDLSGTNFSVACDSEGNVYWNNTTLNVIQKVDLNGNQTVFSNEVYPVMSLTIMGDHMFVVTSANDNIYQIPLTGSPTWTAVCSIPSGYLIASDSAANVYVVSSSTYKIYYFAAESTSVMTSSNLFTPAEYVTLPTSTILSSMCGGYFGNPDNTETYGVVAAGLTIAINSLRVIISYSGPDGIQDTVLVATGLHATSGLAYDNAANLYSGSTARTLRGITKISSNGYDISPYAPGFSTVGGIATSRKGFIFFSDGSNLCQLPIAITTVSASVKAALMSHNYDTIIAILSKGATVTLQPSDITAINSTLPPGSQAQTPITEPVTYTAPNLDGSVTLSPPSTLSQVTYATSFKPGVPTTIRIGQYPPTVVTFNTTSPPTLTIQNNGSNSSRPYTSDTNSNPPATSSFTISPGQEFSFDVNTLGLTLYSLGLTVFTITEGSPAFIPGVRGTPPPVCKPKKQGMDYSQYLSSNVQNAEYLPYKEKTIDASEWIRRKRMTSSVKFGSC